MAVCRLKPVKGCTKAIPEFLMKWIGLLGKKVARYPGWFIAVSIAVAAGFATGLQRMKYLTDIEELFIPTLARGIQVNLCQKLLFLHQSTHNMTTDCSLNYKINT